MCIHGSTILLTLMILKYLSNQKYSKNILMDLDIHKHLTVDCTSTAIAERKTLMQLQGALRQSDVIPKSKINYSPTRFP